MRVLVCGGRDFTDRVWVFRVLDGMHNKERIFAIIEGGATGADQYAAEWAEVNRVKRISCRADWSRYGKAAGPLRNKSMLGHAPNLVLAFPGGKGTANMVGLARGAGIRVVEMLEPPDDLR